MASITIRNLDESIRTRLRQQAARHGHSMEEEARQLLHAGLALEAAVAAPGLAALAQTLFGLEHGVELSLAPRAPARPVPGWPE